MSVERKIILWTGPKHSGKTGAAQELIRHLRAAGRSVAGLLAPSVHEGGALIGFDALDVSTGQRCALLRRAAPVGATDVGSFAFSGEGLRVGRAALSGEAARRADLVVVDEFGPLELRGGGWRKAVDELVDSSAGAILLVARQEIVPEVERLYPEVSCVVVLAADPRAADTVMATLNAGS